MNTTKTSKTIKSVVVTGLPVTSAKTAPKAAKAVAITGRPILAAETAPKAVNVAATAKPLDIQIAAKTATPETKPAAKVAKRITNSQILAWWPTEGRGEMIIRIMENESISYARAVKRSRRRILNGTVC